MREVVPYLHCVEYDDYIEDKNFSTLHHNPSWDGCTGIIKGNFFGRNFDQPLTPMPEFVVKVNSSAERHASIGMACHYGLREDFNHDPKSTYKLNLLPNHMLDGVNDCGVACEANTLHYEPTWEKWEGVESDNPNAPTIHICFLVRYILDHADSARHAIQLLDDINIVGSKSPYDWELADILHLLISDGTDSFIVEFINNKLYVIDLKEYSNLIPVSTNFYLWPLAHNEDPYQFSIGTERYDILKQVYDGAEESVNGMFSMLKDVAYSNFYNPHYDDIENMWFSEHWLQSDIKVYKKYLSGDPLSSKEEKLVQNMNEAIEHFRTTTIPNFWEAIEEGKRVDGTNNHISLHSVVYDIANKSMSVVTEEKYDVVHTFSL